MGETMTGEKDKIKTQEKLWKIDDETLKTPAHDELVLSLTTNWLFNILPESIKSFRDPLNWSWNYDKEVVSEVVAKQRAIVSLKKKNPTDFTIGRITDNGSVEFGYFYQPQSPPAYAHPNTQLGMQQIIPYRDEYIRRVRREQPSITETSLKELTAKWIEERIKSDYKIYVENFENWKKKEILNMELRNRDTALIPKETENIIKISTDTVRYYNEFCKLIKNLEVAEVATLFSIRHEVPIVQSYNKFIIGYWDIVVRLETTEIKLTRSDGVEHTTKYTGDFPQIYIEAKPLIKSYGVTERQLNTYRTYLRGANHPFDIVCLLTPEPTLDPRFKKAFESQGITIIHPEPQATNNEKEGEIN